MDILGTIRRIVVGEESADAAIEFIKENDSRPFYLEKR